MIRLSPAAIVAILLATPALSADLVVDAAPPAADAPSRAYATVFAGVSLPSATANLRDAGAPGGFDVDIDFDTGYIVGGALGTTVLPNLRGEVEFSVVKASLSDSNLDSTGYNLLGNVWYDIDTGSSFTPYIGGGLGYGYDVITASGSDDDITSSGWLYQLGAGLRFAATETIGLDLGYRYRVQPEAVFSDDFLTQEDLELTSSATNHIVTAGVTVGF